MSTRTQRITEALLDAIRDYAVLRGVEPGPGEDNLDAIQNELLPLIRSRIDAAIPRWTWEDFVPDDSTDNVPDKYILTILDPHGEDVAVIVHRASVTFPMDGPTANMKRAQAQHIVEALNAYDGLPGHA